MDGFGTVLLNLLHLLLLSHWINRLLRLVFCEPFGTNQRAPSPKLTKQLAQLARGTAALNGALFILDDNVLPWPTRSSCLDQLPIHHDRPTSYPNRLLGATRSEDTCSDDK